MKVRRFLRIALLLAGFAAITLSCSIDYVMEFDITDVDYTVGGTTVTVHYTMTNSGKYELENAAIRIEVIIDGATATESWTADGVYLPVMDSISDTFTYVHWTPISIGATAVVTGARWDRNTINL